MSERFDKNTTYFGTEDGRYPGGATAFVLAGENPDQAENDSHDVDGDGKGEPHSPQLILGTVLAAVGAVRRRAPVLREEATVR